MQQWIDNIWALRNDILKAAWQTFEMVSISTVLSTLLGGLIGIGLFASSHPQLYYHRWLYRSLEHTVNIMRAFPFVILMIALSPLTHLITGTTIGPIAACVTLTVSGTFFFARLVEQNLKEVPAGVIEASIGMGAKPQHILFGVLLNEARASMVLSITVLTIGILSYSAAAGMIGGGGLGDLAIRYGYYRYQTEIIIFIVAILILLVIAIQFIGNRVAAALDKR
ncbi:methionine ABC transporter permease [Suttonella ornithocola]|uniref:D-methionine transport system permease protein metI n=1 Tax=Suttonella ornithocola TaxID=279832 RepID=A0A380MNQ5_9GAMM|nr:methionine ABC transporter permease [Suttonella ornithocola]SUO93942.1 D-methionine transport system permease protein metI [Suttonella ornithocola]